MAVHMPEVRSPIATPTRCGPDSGVPVKLMKPEKPCAIWSKPGQWPLGPSLPKPVMLPWISPGFSAMSSAWPMPICAITPARKFSTRMSAFAAISRTIARPSGWRKSSATLFLLRLPER